MRQDTVFEGNIEYPQVLLNYQLLLRGAIQGGNAREVKKIIDNYDDEIGFWDIGAEERDDEVWNLAHEPFPNGTTPLKLAASLGHQNICDILLYNGARDENVIIHNRQTELGNQTGSDHHMEWTDI